MKVLFLAAVLSLSAFAVSADEAEKQELFKKSKEFMDKYYADVIAELKEFEALAAAGRKFTDEEVKTLAAMVAVKQFTKRIAESEELIKLLDKLEEAGEVKDFHIYEQGSPESIQELEKETARLLNNVIKFGFTRY